MLSVKYKPQSVPTYTWRGSHGLTITAAVDTSGRLPLTLRQLTLLQSALQRTWNTCPGVAGVLALKPATAA